MSTFFTKFYNIILSKSLHPDIWKKALIVPLLKKQTPLSISYTGPIINICHVAKPLDSLISKQMSDFLEENNILSEYQSGFRTGYSTLTTLLTLLNDVRKAIDENELTVLLLYDFSKAFNSVNHFQLFSILRHIGFSDEAIYFFFNYLTKRVIYSPDSSEEECSCGVGQGSGPGGLLFIILINFLPNAIIFARMLLFVDDTQTYLHDIIDKLNSIIEKLNVDATSLVNWSKISGLQLNANKTQAIILGSSHNLQLIKQIDVSPIIVDNAIIEFSDSVKNLGLIISANLKWDEQIANIITRTNKSLYFMFSKCQTLPIHLKKQIASQLLFPQFDYACLNFMDLTNEQETSLQRQLNKAVRFIFKLPKREHISPFVKKLNWLPLSLRRKYFRSPASPHCSPARLTCRMPPCDSGRWHDNSLCGSRLAG